MPTPAGPIAGQGRQEIMESNVPEAIALIMSASIMNATYTLPMKSHRSWSWEHSWCAFSVLGIVVVPAIISILTIPHLWSVYASTPASVLAMMALFGAAWGISQVCFGLSLPLVGIAVAFTVSLSTSSATGSLLPLLTQHPDRLWTAQGAVILTGVVLIVLGVTLCSRAGLQRTSAENSRGADSSGSFMKGFSFAVLSGVLGSLLNLGLAYGSGIQQAALARGANPVMTSNAVWLPCVCAGFIPGVLYCLYLMRKNANTQAFFRNSRWYYWPTAASMGLLWYGSIVVYAFATTKLGDTGTAIGWPAFLSAIVVGSNIVGVLAGEWKPSLRGPFRTLLLGLSLLILAIAVLTQAGKIGH
jgi:L-rhamnose-H+ transport protein